MRCKQDVFETEFKQKFPDIYNALVNNDMEELSKHIPQIDFPENIPVYI